jgi:dihydroorotate dehydrogenase electron transfer subunit
MLRDLANISEKFDLPGQVALEEHMGCGLGACLSCACPLRASYIRRDKHWKKPSLQWSEDRRQVYSLICKDGPVYDIQEVNWNEWVV